MTDHFYEYEKMCFKKMSELHRNIRENRGQGFCEKLLMNLLLLNII